MPRYEVAADHFPREAALEERRFDAVIVGAGIAGALIAYKLVKAGKTVLMLEAGPDQTSIKDRNLYVENFYKASQRVPEAAYPAVPAAPKATTLDLYVDPYDGYLDQRASDRQPIPAAARNEWFKSTYERRVGGTTWHWLGTCLRLVPNDFRMKSAYDPPGPGWADWPVSYEDLAPWYDRAAEEMGISGDPELPLRGPPLRRRLSARVPALRAGALPDAADPTLVLGRPRGRRRRRHPDQRAAARRRRLPRRLADAAGAQLAARLPAAAPVLRQQQLHPGVPDPRQVRRDRPRRPVPPSLRPALHPRGPGLRPPARGRRRRPGESGRLPQVGAGGRRPQVPRLHRRRHDLRRRGPRHRDPEAAAELAQRGAAPRRRQLVRAGGQVPDGPQHPAQLRRGQGPRVRLPRAALDLGHRDAEGQPAARQRRRGPATLRVKLPL